MKLNMIKGTDRKSVQAIEVNENIFNAPFNEGLVHQVVTAYLAGSRAGTRAHKSKAQVSGGGIKPWKQKGTGRARAGSIRSPLWRKGGKTFAAVPQDHSQKVNRKMYRAALASILAEHHRNGTLHIIDNIQLANHKTKSMIEWAKNLDLKDALVITSEPSEALLLATRNLPFIDIIDVSMIDPVSLVGFANVVVTENALQHLQESLA